jgi:hypothetical protein
MLFNKNKKRFFGWKKYAMILFLAIILFSGAVRPAYALGAADIFAPLKFVYDKVHDVAVQLYAGAGSYALQTAISRTLNTIAYDTATYLGSGARGQKPQWFTGTPEDEWSKVGEAAMGNFISSLNDQFGGILCEPSLDVKLKIGLGLQNIARPPQPDCTLQKMKANWNQALASKDFLKNFANSFDIRENDLGIALTAQSNLLTAEDQAILNKQAEIGMNGRYTENSNIAGDILGLPNEARTEQTFADNMYYANGFQFTGDALKDAAQVFLNQFAITFFHQKMRELTALMNKNASGGASNSLNNPGAAPQSGGIAGAQGALRQIAEPKFGSGGDIDILSELSTCNDSVYGGVSPTNCVIDQKFRQAIADQKTVREAINEGSLQGDSSLGFLMDGNNIVWNQGYPYRSMIILRKYRIIPVGWEIAAEYISAHAGDSDVAGMNTLNKLTACFADSSQPKWCRGLVDPDWVLKAPLNYCAKQGFGQQILNSQVQDQGVDDKGNKLQPKLSITRTDTYCADEQTCIQEKPDGSCNNAWGYCTEDKRIWKFGSDSCDAKYNTCQTYAPESGGSVSYLKNSLQFCDESQAGCEKYAIASPDVYSADRALLDWTKSSNFIFLNNKAEKCEQSNEGCHEFLRINSGAGTNLIADSDFENDTEVLPIWSVLTGTASISGSLPGGRTGQGVFIDSVGPFTGIASFDRSSAGLPPSALPEGFVMEPEVSYTLTADVYLLTGDATAKVTVGIGRGEDFTQKDTNVHNSWQTISVTLLNNKEILANEFVILGFGADGAPIQFYVDNIKFEISPKATQYSGYRDNNLVYEKFMPAYLRDVCYADPDGGNYSLKDNAPPACNQFARQCNRDEANCERYTKTSDGSKIAAAVTETDLCLPVCVGYNTYIQSEDNFSSNHVKYFIPDSAETCASAAVGCEEFTNLASSTSGGEQKEYYSYLRQCVKPSEATCGDFYSFESSQTQGQQLVRYSLSQTAGAEPNVTENDSLLCSESIYNLPPTDPAYNSDCRQLYNKAGQISYHLYSRTISCTDDCHSYRLTRKNVLESVDSSANCNPSAVSGAALASAFHWDSANNVCDYCKNGGVWSDEQQNCVYKALASESATCDASDNGCAQYNGNSGANSRIVLNSDFENGNNDGWSVGSITNTSYVAGKNSFLIGNLGIINKTLGAVVSSGASYVLSFLARAENNDAELTAELNNGSVIAAFEKSALIKSGQWRMYSLNLPKLDHAINDNEYLTIRVPSTATVYIDNIKLEQITDRHYLLEDSWKTPAVCDEDNNGNPFPLYMLGCAEYTDRLNNTAYLHSFDRLCQDSAVGCEAMIDTFNSTSPDKNDSYGATTTVPADRVVYAVYDTNKLCDASNKGCERLGLASDYSGETAYKDTYLKNNPDAYGSILCGASGVGCDLFTSNEGAAYFKDPGSMVCEWRQAVGIAKDSGWGWYKKKVSRCGGTGDVCFSNKDCFGSTCQVETTADKDLLCPTESLKTISTGGAGKEVMQPGSDGLYHWAGTCPADQSGCTEYIDPTSDFSSNVIFNGDFVQHVGSPTYADGWSNSGASANQQNIALSGNTLYILTVENNNSATIHITGIASLHELQTDNNFAAAANNISVGANQSKTFYVDREISRGATITAGDIRVSSVNNSRIILKKAVVDYQLADGVDKTACNGTANLSNGCVYFNERSIKPAGFTALDSNSWTKYDSLSPINAGLPLNNSNTLLKVRPDRACNQWLACKSYVKDENDKIVCFDIANCNRLDDSGQCANFTVANDNEKGNRTFDPNNASQENIETIKNLTGYVKVGLPTANPITDGKIIPNDLLNFGNMSQKGKTISVPNGDFELFVATSTDGGANWVANPSGWTSTGGASWDPKTADNFFSVVSDPKTAQNQSIAYPMIGKAFLRYSATNDGSDDHFPRSGVIYLKANEQYFISFYVNTSAMQGDAAQIKILNDVGNVTDVVQQGISNGWVLKTQSFIAPSRSISLQLAASNGAAGNIYIDDIEIAPVLLARDASPSPVVGNPDIDTFYDRQICRLFPQANSLACDYYDDNGMLQKGTRGYCLEYDRPPGDPNTCLLWWPIDNVAGSGIQSNTAKGYSGRVPLYYCIGNSDTVFKPYLIITSFFAKGLNAFQPRGADPNQSLIFLSADGVETDMSVAILGTKYYLDSSKTNMLRVYLHDNGGKDNVAFRLAGEYHYLDDTGKEAVKEFDLPKLLRQKCGGTAGGGGCYTDDIAGSIAKCRSNNASECASAGGCPECNIVDISTSCNIDSGDASLDASTCGGVDYFVSGQSGDACTESYLHCEDSNADHWADMDYMINISAHPCGEIANVVSIAGQNKAWTERIRAGGNYLLTCNVGMPTSPFTVTNPLTAENFIVTVSPLPPKQCSSTTNIFPFGSIEAPTGNGSLGYISDPKLWAPLPYYSFDENKTGLMGQLQSVNALQYLFAESYGIWDWNIAQKSYVRNDSKNWSATVNLCPNNVRPPSGGGDCAVAPTVTNMQLNKSVNAYLFGSGFVNLEFNSSVDSQQTPLSSYEIDWGDGTPPLTVTGSDMAARPDPTNPHSVFHAYDYYDLLSKSLNSNIQINNLAPTLTCAGGVCRVKPRVKITDNWGWCSEGYNGVSCPTTGRCVDKDKNPSPSAAQCFANSDCSGTFKFCADGWWEPLGEVVVNQPGT